MCYHSANGSNPRHHHHHNYHHHRTHAKHCTHSKGNHRATLNKELSEHGSNFGCNAQEKLYPGERVSNTGNSFDISLILFRLLNNKNFIECNAIYLLPFFDLQSPVVPMNVNNEYLKLV